MAVFSTGAEHAGQGSLLSGLAGVSDFLLKNLRMDGVELAIEVSRPLEHLFILCCTLRGLPTVRHHSGEM